MERSTLWRAQPCLRLGWREPSSRRRKRRRAAALHAGAELRLRPWARSEPCPYRPVCSRREGENGGLDTQEEVPSLMAEEEPFETALPHRLQIGQNHRFELDTLTSVTEVCRIRDTHVIEAYHGCGRDRAHPSRGRAATGSAPPEGKKKEPLKRRGSLTGRSLIPLTSPCGPWRLSQRSDPPERPPGSAPRQAR